MLTLESFIKAYLLRSTYFKLKLLTAIKLLTNIRIIIINENKFTTIMSYTNANCLFHSSRDFIAEGSLLRLGKQEEYRTRSEPEEGYHLRSPTLTIIRRCSQARGKQVPSLPPVCSAYSTATTTPYLFGGLKETSASLV